MGNFSFDLFLGVLDISVIHLWKFFLLPSFGACFAGRIFQQDVHVTRVFVSKCRWKLFSVYS